MTQNLNFMTHCFRQLVLLQILHSIDSKRNSFCFMLQRAEFNLQYIYQILLSSILYSINNLPKSANALPNILTIYQILQTVIYEVSPKYLTLYPAFDGYLDG